MSKWGYFSSCTYLTPSQYNKLNILYYQTSFNVISQLFFYINWFLVESNPQIIITWSLLSVLLSFSSCFGFTAAFFSLFWFNKTASIMSCNSSYNALKTHSTLPGQQTDKVSDYFTTYFYCPQVAKSCQCKFKCKDWVFALKCKSFIVKDCLFVSFLQRLFYTKWQS